MSSESPSAPPATEPVSSLYDTRLPELSRWRRMQIPVIAAAVISVIRVLGPTLRFEELGMDSTSADIPVPDYVAELERPVRGLKIGVAKEYLGEGLDKEIRSGIEAAIQKLARQGCEIVDVSLPHTKYAIPAYYIVATAEASSNLARFDGVRYGYRANDARTLSEMYRRSRDQAFGAEVKRRIMAPSRLNSSQTRTICSSMTVPMTTRTLPSTARRFPPVMHGLSITARSHPFSSRWMTLRQPSAMSTLTNRFRT